MNTSRTDVLATPGPVTAGTSWWRILCRQRSVQLAALGWVIANAVVLAIGHGAVPFDRPSIANQTFTDEIVGANATMIEIFVQMGSCFC